MTASKWLLGAMAVTLWVSILLAMWQIWAAIALIVLIVLARKTFPQFLPHITVIALGASAVLGVVLTVTHASLRSPAVLEEHIGSEVDLSITTTQTLVPGSRHVRGSLIAVNGASVFPVPVMVFLDTGDTRVPPGVTMSVRGDISKTDTFDSRAWIVYASSWQVTTPASAINVRADSLRAAFLAVSLDRGGDGGALLPGLALGDTTGVSDSLESDMRVSSLAHLVAVSGANCALIVAIAVGIVALLGGGLWWRVGAGVFALAGFVVLVTPEPSVVRASVMATIALIAVAVGRPSAGLQVLSVTAWFLLAMDPWRAVDVAFVLSVAATAGIVLGFAPASAVLERFLPRWLAMAVALPLVAQIAVQPFVILLRPTIPLYGVIANLLAAPFVPFVTIAGLVGALTTPFLPVVSQWSAALGWHPATAIASIARAVARMPFNELPWIPGLTGLAVALVVSVGWWTIFSGRVKLGASLVSISVVLVVLVTQAPRLAASLTLPRSWDIAQCDVGQGDALLVRTSEGFLAIDTGNNEQALEECLALLRISRVRWLVLTHFDVDHVGQSDVYRSRVNTVLTGPPDNGEDENRLAGLARSGARIQAVTSGDVIDAGSHRVLIVWPESPALGDAGNDTSVTVLVEPIAAGEGLSLLALGDLGESAQRMMMPRLPGVPVDVVKVSHHGSPDQYDGLYFSLRAPVGLIGVGADNTYGHPAEQTLSLLKGSGTLPLRSDQRGTIVLSGTPEGISVWSERGD